MNGQATLAFTAVFLKCEGGYVGFVEEIPGVNSHGRTLDEARRALVELTRVVFDEERRSARDLLAGKEALREPFSLTMGAAPATAEARRRNAGAARRLSGPAAYRDATGASALSGSRTA
jgi:predicted RNase H-like HicB family nuclease